MSQFTQGPLERRGHVVYSTGDRPMVIAEALWLPEGEDIANARLIAVAPEMAALLERLVNASPAQIEALQTEAQFLLKRVKNG
jgi:hypothetical protein